MTVGKNTPNARVTILEPSPMPNQMMNSGTSAIFGIGNSADTTRHAGRAEHGRTARPPAPMAMPEHGADGPADRQPRQRHRQVVPQLAADASAPTAPARSRPAPAGTASGSARPRRPPATAPPCPISVADRRPAAGRAARNRRRGTGPVRQAGRMRSTFPLRRRGVVADHRATASARAPARSGSAAPRSDSGRSMRRISRTRPGRRDSTTIWWPSRTASARLCVT